MRIRNVIQNIVSNPGAFFLKNSGVKQTIAKNTFWLAIAEGVTRFLKLFLIIYIARILGATEYGKFTFALAFVSLFAIFSDFGISTITTREIAREKEKEKEFPAVLSLKLVLSIGTLFLICIGSFFITLDLVIRGIIWILGVYIIVSSFSEIVFAFFASCVTILGVVFTGVIGLFPNLIPSSLDTAYSMTIYNTSSSHYTLKIMTVVVLLFVPIVLLYQIWNYTVFKKPVTEEDLYDPESETY